ncbi:glycoside hydrolase family 97 protein [Asticcacaulis taihuensis]|uniref:Alpha-glucosidase n=1 Tax=Asticcacaulis taihuensis TaxID=260084 RepID=A0A1G4TKL2_9CAUL|nr:glycoside hydrolase family 97 protein [Asticcacaulis taihuensis]SCW81970.1 alpha-glucosidase [Asticcacaulis taihuensis]
MIFAMLAAASAFLVQSPDKSIEVQLSTDGSHYTVQRGGEEIIAPSPLGITPANAAGYSDLLPVEARRDHIKRMVPLIATKAASTSEDYNSLVVTYREKTSLHRQISIEVRAYNDGIAFRYLLPKGQAYAIKDELTGYRFAYDPVCEVTDYTSSHENTWRAVPVSQLDSAKTLDMPVVCASASGRTHFAITQSNLAGYTGSAFQARPDGFQVHLTPHPGDAGVAVTSADGLSSAWRVVMMADRAGDLISSHLIGNVATQPVGDFSWVKPGKAAWDWWSGPTAGEKPTMERFKRFIDFAAESGFPYFLIDAGWAYGSTPCCNADPKTDITRPEPNIDMPELVRYANERHVGLLLWVHWQHIAPRIDEVLDTYQKWGIKGIKIDFTERDDQEMVKFFHDMAEATARRHLLLDMHGAYTPAGLERTYPNYITQEGVLGAEYNKFSDRITPAHNVRLAYTRMLLGPMDYTPGGFHNGTPETYKTREIMPMTQTTRGQALAMYVVYDSPLQMVSDDPSAYEGQSGFDFIKTVPTAWDETRFLDGTPETFVALARRKGNTWYVGVMTNADGRSVTLPLTFLGKGAYTAKIWQDGADANSVVSTPKTIRSDGSLSLDVKPAGGAVVVLTPK